MSKEYIAKESTSQQILSGISPYNMTNVNVYIGDYINDTKTIITGGLDTYHRRIYCS